MWRADLHSAETCKARGGGVSKGRRWRGEVEEEGENRTAAPHRAGRRTLEAAVRRTPGRARVCTHVCVCVCVCVCVFCADESWKPDERDEGNKRGDPCNELPFSLSLSLCRTSRQALWTVIDYSHK